MVRAADFGILLDDLAITHLSFGSEVRVTESRCAGLAERPPQRGCLEGLRGGLGMVYG